MNDDKVVDGLYALARSINHAGQTLGLNNAATDMGALELLSKSVSDGSDAIATSIDNLAHSIDRIADALTQE